jgi:hypothetical protein
MDAGRLPARRAISRVVDGSPLARLELRHIGQLRSETMASSYLTALATAPAVRVPLLLAAALAAFLLLPSVQANPVLHATFIAVPVLLTLWQLIVVSVAARRGRQLGFDVVIHRPHWVQPLAQGSVYAYWGWYWPEVYAFLPFVAAQIVFLYAFDMLLAWSRRDRYQLGFGPFPIILSTNLFLWFRPDWFYLQFALVAVGSLGKEFVRWRREGRSTHIFNPSALSLSVFSVLLLLTGSTSLTWGIEIASTQQTPPYIYHWLFLIGFIGGTLFRVTTMTVSAATALVVIGAIYTANTGTYYFIDTSIPAAVFLGMHLLFTDPSTSPRTDLGRVVFGTFYGASIFVLYVGLDAIGQPTFYDKLLAVPILNLSVQAIDRIAAKYGRWRDLALPFSPAQRNAVYLGVWIVIFGIMLSTHAVGQDHEGRSTEFWAMACQENRPRACKSLFTVQSNRCRDGVAQSCNELGLLLNDGRAVRRDDVAALANFERACALGLEAGCANAATLRSGASPRGQALDSACAAGDARACTALGLRYLEGTAGSVDFGAARAALERGCTLGEGVACANLGLMYRRGAGVAADEGKAREFLTRACSMGVADACRQLAGAP